MSSPDKQNSQQHNVYWKDGLQQSQMNFNNLQDQQQIPPHHQQANQFFQNNPNPNARYHPTNNMQMNVNQQQQQPMEQQQNFTVLSDGLGNYFLKVYHNNNDAIDFQNPNQKYELFSNPNNFLFNNVQQQQQQPQNFQQPTEAMQSQSFINQEMQTSDDLEEQRPGNNITNMFINQLVGNWAPNATGNYTPFGESSNFRNDIQPNQSFSAVSVASQQQEHVTMHQNSPGKLQDSEIFNTHQNKPFLGKY
jgi:hypothetical protein